MKTNESELQRVVSGACLIVAPLLMLTGNLLRFALDSAYLWHPTLNIIAMGLYVPAILGLKHLLRFRAPRIAVYVCNLAMILAVIGLSVLWGRLISRAALPDEAAALVIQKALFGTLVLFPMIALLYWLFRAVIGFGLWRAKIVPAWVGLLMALGSLMFPIANIGFDHIPAVIHLTDLSLLIADGWIGWKILAQKSFWEQDAGLPESRPT
jgi:hypothetical protein